MKSQFRFLVACSLAVMVALLIEGAASHGVLRNIVQTSPLWIVISLSERQSSLSKWVALPCFIFWVLLITSLWLSLLLGWIRIVSGGTPIENALTVIAELASLAGIFIALRMRTPVRFLQATGTLLVIAALQVAAHSVSLLPAIAHR